MTQPQHLTYAAIITLTLPGMERPATVSVTLTPQATIETASGQVKPLRDCSLAELQAFADALEAELWARYRDSNLGELAQAEDTQLKITLLGDDGQSRRLTAEAWLEHAIVLEEPLPAPSTEAEARASEPEAEETGSEADVTGATEEETAGISQGSARAATGKPQEEETATAAEVVAAEAATGDTVEREAEIEETPPAAAPEEALREAEQAPESAEPAPAGEAPVAPPPEETPVVPGPEPSTAPPGVEPAGTRELRIAGLRRPVGHPTPAAVDILINEPTFRDTQAHSLTSLNREVAGMLIGPQPEKQPDGRYVVHITDAIIARHTRMHGASVTYTPESWRYITDVLHERYPNEEAVIVGWYHTHPGFGIFLSGMDLFIHQNFFTQKWHVALVLDPIARKSGFFCWDRGQRSVQAYDFPWPPWAGGAW